MRDAVIVAYGRSAIGKANKGQLRHTSPESLAAQVVKGTLEKVPQLNTEEIDDFVLGCAFQEAEQGLNIAKLVASMADLPDKVPAQTVNRFCSSGLQTISIAANSIMCGQMDVVLAGGLESMSSVPIGGNSYIASLEMFEKDPRTHLGMGITAENVADKYNITRLQQDEFAVQSHRKALDAQKKGKFKSDIIPVNAIRLGTDENGKKISETFVFSEDEGIRPNTSVESLVKLRPAFKLKGSVTAGNSSQTSDGAAIVLLMSREKAEELNLKPIATFRSFAVQGVDPALMGIGPIKAIPKALGIAKVEQSQIDLIELNEAFASQSIACINELELDQSILNVNGGAIALGHPLGCTGAFLTIKLLSEMERRNSKYGLVSMCIGGGMGAAAVFEM